MTVDQFGRVILALQVALLAFCGVGVDAVQADDGPDYAREAAYIALAVGVASDTALEDELEDLTGVNANVKQSAALQARVGYRVAPHLATELQLEFNPKFTGEAFGMDVWTHRTVVFTGNAKVPVLRGRIQPYVLAGAGFLHGRFEDELGFGLAFDDTDFAMRFGGGLDLYATEHISVGLDLSYVLPFDEVEHFNYLSFVVGLQYNF